MKRAALFAIVLFAAVLPLAHAGDITLTPMSWQSKDKLAADKAYVLVGADGAEIEAQADAENRLWWMGDAADTKAAYTLKEKPAGSSHAHVEVQRAGEEQITVTLDGKPFTTLNMKKGEPRPYLYPVLSPMGDRVTREWPMKDVPEEKAAKQQDHDHHRSIWTAHGDIRTPDHPAKVSYWETDISKGGQVVHRPGTGYQRVSKIVRTVSGPVFGEITLDVDWTTDDGKRQFSDTRTYRFFRGTPDQRVLDYDMTLHFPESDVTFAATKEGGLFSFRVATSMTEKPGKGHMVNSKGQKGMDACWGEPAEWCDYVGPVGENTVGVAIFDAPSNFRHPVRWHIRNYGLYTANPFIGHKDKKEVAESGDQTWKKGENVAFRYRCIIHKGDTAEAKIAERYTAYAKPATVKIAP